MGNEIEELKEEIAQLREDVEMLKGMLGVGESATTEPPEIVCKSLRVPGPDGDVVYIGQWQDRDACAIFLKCAGGNRLQIQGLYPDQAIRMYASGTNDKLFSIGGGTKYGKIRVETVRSKAGVELRAMPSSGYVDTYGEDGHLTDRLPGKRTD